jgi:ATP-dependent protease Clp ATPase subunit
MKSDFVTKYDLLEIVSEKNAERLNEILTSVASAAVEEALRLLPTVTAQLIKTSVAIENMSGEFLEKNPGFKDNIGIVQKVVMQTEAENPGSNYSQVLEKAAPKIKEAIQLSAKAVASEKNLNFNSIIEGDK